VDKVSNVWTVQIAVTTPNGWQTFIRNLAYPLTSAEQIEMLVSRHVPEYTGIVSLAYLSWPGLPAHFSAAPEATPERVASLRANGYGGKPCTLPAQREA